MQKNNIAIILNGGTGKRFGGLFPKQFLKLNEQTILEITVKKFLNSDLFKKVIIVSHKDFLTKTTSLFDNKIIVIVKGGRTRQDSVLNGLQECKKLSPDNVVIHDAVRPFFSEKIIPKILKKLKSNDCIVPLLSIKDSVRYSKKDIYKDINRDHLNQIQTPQGFKFKKIYDAHCKFKKFKFTDDSIISYNNGNKIFCIEGEITNFKITTKDDYKLAKNIFGNSMGKNLIKVGQGFDVHRFKKGKELKILGIKIPFNKSLEGHSDADVGFHSIVDAVLGALSKGDIGEHFPPSEQKWKNKPSIYFMTYAKNLLIDEGFKINNIDITLICEKPKIGPHKTKMIKSIAKALHLKINNINVKATTTEKLGFLGREEGIACQASVTISKIDDS